MLAHGLLAGVLHCGALALQVFQVIVHVSDIARISSGRRQRCQPAHRPLRLCQLKRQSVCRPDGLRHQLLCVLFECHSFKQCEKGNFLLCDQSVTSKISSMRSGPENQKSSHRKFSTGFRGSGRHHSLKLSHILIGEILMAGSTRKGHFRLNCQHASLRSLPAEPPGLPCALPAQRCWHRCAGQPQHPASPPALSALAHPGGAASDTWHQEQTSVLRAEGPYHQDVPRANLHADVLLKPVTIQKPRGPSFCKHAMLINVVLGPKFWDYLESPLPCRLGLQALQGI